MSLIDIFAPRLAMKVEGRKVALMGAWETARPTPEQQRQNRIQRDRRYRQQRKAA